ncbi:MAG TPA: hypothetical protein DGR79_07920 [Clostridiales bacterium]|nr:hypothetical protein [Clostridiales bacterium]
MAVFHRPDDDIEHEDHGPAVSAERVERSGGRRGDGWLETFLDYAGRNRGRLLGVTIGLLFGLSVKWLGLLWTVFISACAVAGYLIGKKLDENQEGLLEFLDRVLPPGRD